MTRFSAAASLLLLFLAVSCRETAQSTDSKDAVDAPLVEAVPVRTGALPLTERVTGTVKARNQVAIRAEVESPIVEVYVRSGEQVKEGQPLVRHRDVELREQLRRAEADVQVAEASARQERARVAELDAQVRRARALAAGQLISKADLETLEAQLAAARAGADEASARIAQARAIADERRAALSRAIVRAPVAGWIGQRNAEVGMLPRSDTLLFLIGDLENVIVDIPLTQEMLGTIRSGAPVVVHAGAEPLRAAITRISPFLAEGSRSTIAEVDLANADHQLRPGMSVKVDVVRGESRTGTLVPLSALYEDPQNGRLSVFVVGAMNERVKEDQPRTVAMRAVEVLARGAGAAAVQGVSGNEWVVTVGQNLLATDRAKVARVRPTTWDRVLQLQGLQREDLLAEFLEKQQRIARTRGAEPPSSAEYLGAAAKLD